MEKMKTKNQYIKSNIGWNLFFSILYSTIYLLPLILVFNFNQAMLIYIILISINYNNLIDSDYNDYCIQFKQDKENNK